MATKAGNLKQHIKSTYEKVNFGQILNVPSPNI